MQQPPKQLTCCFTGHRTLPTQQLSTLQEDLRDEIVRRLCQGYRWFAAGGAIGFDTMAALTVLQLRQTHPEIGLWLVLPCKDQTSRWGREARQVYEHILRQADQVEYVSEWHTATCMKQRNLRLVQVSSSCICYLSKASGGTYYTVRQALQSDIPITNLARAYGSELILS